MITKLIIIAVEVLGIALYTFVLLFLYPHEYKVRIKNLHQENDALLKTNYKLATKLQAKKGVIESQEKIINDLANEVKQYRNSFNNN